VRLDAGNALSAQTGAGDALSAQIMQMVAMVEAWWFPPWEFHASRALSADHADSRHGRGVAVPAPGSFARTVAVVHSAFAFGRDFGLLIGS